MRFVHPERSFFMLDSIHVVIQMTGLLLLAPDRPSGSGPTHVLLPATNGLPTHLAWMAYTADSLESVNRCQEYLSGLCIVDLDGWSLTLGSGGKPAPTTNRVPPSALNLTRGKGRPVDRDRLGQRPGRKVRSRVSLLAGEVTDTCVLADWEYDDVDPATGLDTVPLANMVEWKIRNIAQGHLPMVLSPLDSMAGDRRMDLPALRAAVSDTAEIFIMHIPLAEAMGFTGALQGLGARAIERRQDAPMHAGPDTATRLDRAGARRAAAPHGMDADPDTATHFQAYYDLLRASNTSTARPLPHKPKGRKNMCEFTTRTLAGGKKELFGLETLSCMVASARPL